MDRVAVQRIVEGNFAVPLHEGLLITHLCEATGLGRASLYHHFNGYERQF